MKIIKRDGKIEDFDFSKIQRAVNQAFKSAKIEMTDKFSQQMQENFEKWSEDCQDCEVSTEKIHDLVEKYLMKKNQYDPMKQYMKKREERDRARRLNERLVRGVKEKLEAKNVQNQNANVDENSFGGRIGEAARLLTKEYALDYCMTEMSRNNHLNNEIYIHDLDSYAVGEHNCLSVPFDDLLANGFNTRQTDVRPANSINTAFQLVAVLFQLQSLQQFGGVSATHIDWTMVPYVRKSFMKHYLTAYIKTTEDFAKLDLMNMLFDNYTDKIGVIRNRYDDWFDEHKHSYMEKLSLTVDDFFLGNDKLDKALYQSALFDTINETHQAVEGMYHNLNTLQSRSGRHDCRLAA